MAERRRVFRESMTAGSATGEEGPSSPSLAPVSASGREARRALAAPYAKLSKAPSTEGAVATPQSQELRAPTNITTNERRKAIDGHMSQQEEKASKYTKVLQEGANGIKGLLRKESRVGVALRPYAHQRQFVQRFSRNAAPKTMCCYHDAGLGKSATATQMFAAIELITHSGCIMVIVCLPVLLMQWKATCMDWLDIPENQIFVTNEKKKMTKEKLRSVRVLITTLHTVAGLHKQCWEHMPENKDLQIPPHWRRKPGVPLHPLFGEEVMAFNVHTNKDELMLQKWVDFLVQDESHLFRNVDSTWCESMQQMSRASRRIMALTATPIFNRPDDMRGQCKAMDMKPVSINGQLVDFQTKEAWIGDKKGLTINEKTFRYFQHVYQDRVTDAILNLPPIVNTYVDFKPNLSYQDAMHYNRIRATANSIRISIETGSSRRGDVNHYYDNLGKMQQMLVSPRLGRNGAEEYKKHPAWMDADVANPSASIQTLVDQVEAFWAKGQLLVCVCAMHTTGMVLAQRVLEQREARRALGPDEPRCEFFAFNGESGSYAKRTKIQFDFLNAKKAVIFLSIDAAGTGLNLVPGCSAMIFWGSRPWSPQQVWQTTKRIHRIGQDQQVNVVHIIALGSVDHALTKIHVDKAGLSNALLDNDWEHFSQSDTWRKNGTIIKNTLDMNQTGNFVEAETISTAILAATTAWNQTLQNHNGDKAADGKPDEARKKPKMVTTAPYAAPPSVVPKQPGVPLGRAAIQAHAWADFNQIMRQGAKEKLPPL